MRMVNLSTTTVLTKIDQFSAQLAPAIALFDRVIDRMSPLMPVKAAVCSGNAFVCSQRCIQWNTLCYNRSYPCCSVFGCGTDGLYTRNYVTANYGGPYYCTTGEGTFECYDCGCPC